MAIDTARAVTAILARTQVLMDPENPGYPPSDEDVMSVLVEEIMGEILAHMEINNLQINLSPFFAQAWSGVPVPLDGGTALKVAASAAIIAGLLGVQTNGGEGLLS